MEKDQDEILLHMEVFYNAQVYESTKMAPHKIMYGSILKSAADRLIGKSTEQISTKSIKDYLEKMQETWKNVSANLEKAKEIQKKHADACQ